MNWDIENGKMNEMNEDCEQKYPYLYLLKKEIIYKVLKCPKETIIPTNDIEAWNWSIGKSYQWIYNKIKICKSQGIRCGPIGIFPEKTDYPVILKPIINLMGMGWGIEKATCKKEYCINFKPGYFWMPYVEGDHLSCDFVMVKGEIKWYCCFQGYPSNGGMFDYWETQPFWKPSEKIIKWITDNLIDYTGCLNIEIIGRGDSEVIIESHLRMGDINQLHSLELMQNIINIYSGKEWELDSKFTIPKIYLVPVFVSNYLPMRLTGKEVLSLCNKIDIEKKHIYTYQIDPPHNKSINPPGGIRIVNLNTNCLEIGIEIRKHILLKIKRRKVMLLFFIFFIIYLFFIN